LETESKPVSFNVNVFVAGLLVAVVISALGFGGSATVQWIVPGVIVLVAIGAAVLWPGGGRKKGRDTAGTAPQA
jgi:hypothetical protein